MVEDYARPEMGRFGVKLEGSGKVRVFAIANPLLQALVRPLHDWAMDVLRLLPTDGSISSDLSGDYEERKTSTPLTLKQLLTLFQST